MSFSVISIIVYFLLLLVLNIMQVVNSRNLARMRREKDELADMVSKLSNEVDYLTQTQRAVAAMDRPQERAHVCPGCNELRGVSDFAEGDYLCSVCRNETS